MIGRNIGSNWITQCCLGGLAAVAARRHRLVIAATLWGAAEHVEEVHGMQMLRAERGRYEKILDPLLNDPALASVREAGRELDTEHAVTQALASVE